MAWEEFSVGMTELSLALEEWSKAEEAMRDARPHDRRFNSILALHTAASDRLRAAWQRLMRSNQPKEGGDGAA